MLLRERLSEHAEICADEPAWPLKEDPDNHAVPTTADSVHLARRLAKRIGASGFSLLLCGTEGETRRLAPVFDDAFPGVSHLSQALSQRGVESFARLTDASSVPLWWMRPGGLPFMSEAASCWAREIESPVQDNSGIAFPISQDRGRHGVMVFSGDMMALDEVLLCDIHARCFVLFEQVARQRDRHYTDKVPPISKREIECLRLTADGLTSDDIAASLGLSVHTANQYLTNTAAKLNAVNRIHAVAKALRFGLID